MQPISAIDTTQLPVDIQKASTEDQQKYAAAQQFEQMLVQKMVASATSVLSADGGDEGGGDEDGSIGSSSDAASNHYKDLLPELMAKAMVTGDGLGIARDLYDAMKKQA
jgi:Rod binding domain-containing protein